MYRINEIPMKIPMVCSVETEKRILRFTWNPKGPRIGKIKILRKKNKAEGQVPLDLQAHGTGTMRAIQTDGAEQRTQK